MGASNKSGRAAEESLADAPPGLRLEWMDPAGLNDNPMNWRTHPAGQKAALTAALEKVGWAGALLFNERTNRLIDGHARKELTAARAAGGKVPVLVGSWSEEQERLILATLDPLAAMAEANKDALDKLLREVATGNDQRLDALLAELARQEGIVLPEGGAGTPPDDPGPQIDRAAELRAKWGTAPGQLWLIPSKATPGKCHRIACGDSTRAEDVARLMRGEKATLCATDPPYLVDYTGDRPNDSGKDWTATYREIDIPDAYAFFVAVFKNVLEAIAPHAAIYCWHAHKRCGVIQKVWAELGILDHQQVVWVKPTPVFGRCFWHFRHEPCMMGWRKGSIPEHDGDQELNSVWEIDWEGKARIVGNDHPTQKPVEIFARPIRKHTKPGDVVFEPFCGSGSQVVAAEQTGRLCYAIDLSAAYVAVALERLSGCGLEPRLEAPPAGGAAGPL
jgi:DNA modification methylase